VTHPNGRRLPAGGRLRYHPGVPNASAPALLLAVSLLSACASTEPERPDVSVTAAEDAEGTRVVFQLEKGNVTAHDFHLEVDNGELRDICRSPDLRRVSVLWSREEGTLRCKFPYGQTGEWTSDGDVLNDQFEYVFLDSKLGRVTSRVPRGATMRPRLLLHVEVPKAELPARLVFFGRDPRELVRESSMIVVALPANEKGVLETGEWKVEMTTKAGSTEFLIGVDPDGTPAATNGYVRLVR